MTTRIDLSGAPSDEDCAQLGITRDFAVANTLEVEAYRAAMIATFGPPPEGLELEIGENAHDFGLYRTLILADRRADIRVPLSEAAIGYAGRVAAGIAHWHQAGLAAPVTYDRSSQIHRRKGSIVDVVFDALATTRPDRAGHYAVAHFATLHENLSAAYPDIAQIYRDGFAREADHVE